MDRRIGTLILSAAVAALLLTGAARTSHAAAPQEFIDACQDDALRLCNQEAMSQDDARINRCMKAHKHLVSKRCLIAAKKYKRL
jgi:hypothetical protein